MRHTPMPLSGRRAKHPFGKIDSGSGKWRDCPRDGVADAREELAHSCLASHKIAAIDKPGLGGVTVEFMADSSFDIVSEINMQEVDNAINQAQKEIGTRYDFKGTAAGI